jgi:hypothetical protein
MGQASARPVGQRLAIAAALVVACTAIAGGAAAQVGNLCQTYQGACLSSPAMLGTPCACFTPYGPIAGYILGGGGGGQSMASPVCRTFRGVCQIPGVAPVGTQCNCYGDPGQIVPP